MAANTDRRAAAGGKSRVVHGGQPRNAPIDRRQRLAGLDLLRLVAAVAIVAFHFGYAGPARPFMTTGFPELSGVARYGFLGVDLFFIISGFVIAASTQGRGFGQFAFARVVRLYPGHVVCMTISAVVLALWGLPPHGATFVQWVANLTMVSPALGQPFIDGAYWSIVLELVFYAWVAALVGLGLFERRTLTIVAVWLAVCFLNEAVLHVKPLRILLLTEYGPMFASGILLQRIHRGDQRLAVWCLLGCAASLALLHAFEVQAVFARLYDAKIDIGMVWLLTVVVYAVFVTAVAVSARIHATPMVLTLGSLTYPLYLLHQNIGYVSIDRLAPYTGRWAALVITLAAIVTVAWLVARFAEPMGRRMLGTLMARTNLNLAGRRANYSANLAVSAR